MPDAVLLAADEAVVLGLEESSLLVDDDVVATEDVVELVENVELAPTATESGGSKSLLGCESASQSGDD